MMLKKEEKIRQDTESREQDLRKELQLIGAKLDNALSLSMEAAQLMNIPDIERKE